MLRDKWFGLFLVIALLALTALLPGVPELVAALVTGIPNLAYAVAVIFSGIGIALRYMYLRLKGL